MTSWLCAGGRRSLPAARPLAAPWPPGPPRGLAAPGPAPPRPGDGPEGEGERGAPASRTVRPRRPRWGGAGRGARPARGLTAAPRLGAWGGGANAALSPKGVPAGRWVEAGGRPLCAGGVLGLASCCGGLGAGPCCCSEPLNTEPCAYP